MRGVCHSARLGLFISNLFARPLASLSTHRQLHSAAGVLPIPTEEVAAGAYALVLT